jgi:hypothetical protein
MGTRIHKYGNGWRTQNRRVQKHVPLSLDDLVYGSLPEFFAKVTARVAEAGLVDAEVSMEEFSQGWSDMDDRREFCVLGWRDATPDEIAEAETRLAEQQARDAEYKAARVEAAERLLREQRPELFQP